MRLGVHVRIASGLDKALDRARLLGCEAVQLFSSNPNSWACRPIDINAAAIFKSAAAALDIYPIIFHTPYLLNLASPDDDIWRKSCQALANAVSRAPYMGVKYIVTHIGSHKGGGYEGGVLRIQEAVKYALDAADGPVIALELGSGAGNSIGFRFEQIADILQGLQDQADRVGICIDTAHLWGAGYPISDEAGVNAMFNDLKYYVGLRYLRVIHLNDTQKDLGSHTDRHYHIGEGQIGREGFRAMLHYPGTEELPGIIETPGQDEMESDMKNLTTLRELRY